MERADRQLAWTGVLVSTLLLLTAVPVGLFYQAYWSRITHLPTLVARREKRAGGRWTPLNHVSPWLPRALIATEDRTFSSNLGVSFEGIGRSVLVDLRTGRFSEGGSTLTQQLVRDTLLTPAKEFRRKVSEALLAVMVTALYSKQEILTLYLNEVYLGAGAYGIQAASQRYFGLPPQALTLPEAALVAGLPQAPTAFNPLAHLTASKHRQWQVLQSMVADQILRPAAAIRAYRAPLPFK